MADQPDGGVECPAAQVREHLCPAAHVCGHYIIILSGHRAAHVRGGKRLQPEVGGCATEVVAQAEPAVVSSGDGLAGPRVTNELEHLPGIVYGSNAKRLIRRPRIVPLYEPALSVGGTGQGHIGRLHGISVVQGPQPFVFVDGNEGPLLRRTAGIAVGERQGHVVGHAAAVGHKTARRYVLHDISGSGFQRNLRACRRPQRQQGQQHEGSFPE